MGIAQQESLEVKNLWSSEVLNAIPGPSFNSSFVGYTRNGNCIDGNVKYTPIPKR